MKRPQIFYLQLKRSEKVVVEVISGFEFKRYSVRISAGTLAVLIEAFRRFPQFLQVIFRLGHEHFLPHSLKFIINQ
jgi:hypothetical protein